MKAIKILLALALWPALASAQTATIAAPPPLPIIPGIVLPTTSLSPSFVNAIANAFCMSRITKDSYWAEVGANDPGLYTNGTACANGTLRLDVNATRALFAVPVIGTYGTVAAVGLGIDASTGFYGSAGILRASCGNIANCLVLTNSSASVNGNFNMAFSQATAYQTSTGVLMISSTPPTVASGFGSSAAGTVTNGASTLSFLVTVGTNAGGTTGVLTLPTALVGWSCSLSDVTNTLDLTRQTAYSVTSASFSTTVAWTTGDKLVGMCGPF